MCYESTSSKDFVFDIKHTWLYSEHLVQCLG